MSTFWGVFIIVAAALLGILVVFGIGMIVEYIRDRRAYDSMVDYCKQDAEATESVFDINQLDRWDP